MVLLRPQKASGSKSGDHLFDTLFAPPLRPNSGAQFAYPWWTEFMKPLATIILLANLLLTLAAHARDPYEVLGVTRETPFDQIKQRYRELAKKHHPDRNPGDADAERRFTEIAAAFEEIYEALQRGPFYTRQTPDKDREDIRRAYEEADQV